MSSKTAVEEAFFESFGAILQVLTIIFVGAVSASQGLLPTPIRKALATLNFKVFLPSLILSTAASYDAPDLVRYSPLMLASIFHILLGLTLGAIIGKSFNLPSPDRQFLLLTTAFNNNGGLPFILLVPLCETWGPALDEGPSALGRAFGMVMIYCLPWYFLMFTLGLWIIKDAAQDTVNSVEEATSPVNPLHEPPCPHCTNETKSDNGKNWSISSTENIAWKFVTSGFEEIKKYPNIPASLLAVALACSGPVKEFLFGGSLTFVGGTWKQLGACAPVVSTFVLSAGLYSSMYPLVPLKETSPNRLLNESLSSSNSGMVNSNLVTRGGSEPMVDKFAHSISTEAMVERMKMDNENCPIVDKSSLETEELAFEEEAGNGDARAKWRQLVLMSSGLKLIVMPLICFPLTLLVIRHTGFAKDDKMLQMILLIECAVPSSQTAVALMQLETSSKLANRMASLYLPMYCAAAFTLSFWVASAIYLLR